MSRALIFLTVVSVLFGYADEITFKSGFVVRSASVIEIKLTAEETAALKKSADDVKVNMDKVKL